MAKIKKFYWLKLEKNFFKRHDIQIIESMENGKDYVLFYLKLILESINHDGKLRFNDLVPYNDKMLSTITNTNVDVVRSAIKIFEQLGLMEIWEDQTIYLQDTQKMLGFETEWAQKKRDYKSRIQVDVTQEQLPNSYPYKLGKCEVLSQEQIRLPNGSVRYVDEKRYGGNGMIALAKADGKCRLCGDDEKVVIHHSNGYSNELEDLEVLCTKCHGKEHTKTPIGHDSEIVRQEIELEIELDKEIYKDIVELHSPSYPYSDIIEYLNQKAETKYRASSKKTQGLIKARFKEGFELEDFKKVIDKKTNEWKSDNKMSVFLRPETLFGTKFESYLNQKGTKVEKDIGNDGSEFGLIL